MISEESDLLGSSEYSTEEELETIVKAKVAENKKADASSNKGIRKFLGEIKPQLEAEYPSAKASQISKMAKRRWEELDDVERTSMCK